MVKRSFQTYRSPVSGEMIRSSREKDRDHVRTDTMPSQDVTLKERHMRPSQKGEG